LGNWNRKTLMYEIRTFCSFCLLVLTEALILREWVTSYDASQLILPEFPLKLICLVVDDYLHYQQIVIKQHM